MNRFQVESTGATELSRQKDLVTALLKEIQDEENNSTEKESTKTKSTNKEKRVDDNYVSTDEEISDCESVDLADLTSDLYTLLESSIASRDHAQQIEILKFLVEKDVVDIELIKRMVAHYVTLEPENAPELLKNLRNAQVPIQGAELHELYLLHVIHLIWQGHGEKKLNQEHKRFEEAAKAVNPNLDGLGLKKYRKRGAVRNQGSLTCSGLLDAYGVLLQYDAQYWGDREGEAELDLVHLISRLDNAFTTSRPYLHLFAEPYVFFLVQNGQHDEAERFIIKYVNEEMADRMASRGMSPLLAYEIVLVHMPKASQKFHQQILEALAKVDPGNLHVLKLCRIYQKMSFKKPSKNCDPLDLTPTPLSRCLELVAYFLDQPAPHPLPPHFIEAWSILADVLRVICQKGSEEEVKMVLELWHLDRRDWWPSLHFRFQSARSLEDGSLNNKALVSFLLSDTGDKEKYASFTNDVIREKKSPNLESLIKQLGPYQLKLRARFQQLLPDLMRDKYPHRLRGFEKPSTPTVPSHSDTPSTLEEDETVDINLGRYGSNEELTWSETSDTRSEESSQESNDEEEACYDIDIAKNQVRRSRHITKTYKLPLKNALTERFNERRSFRPHYEENDPPFTLKRRYKINDIDPWSDRLRSSGRTDFIELPGEMSSEDLQGYFQIRRPNPSRCASSFCTRNKEPKIPTQNGTWIITENQTIEAPSVTEKEVKKKERKKRTQAQILQDDIVNRALEENLRAEKEERKRKKRTQAQILTEQNACAVINDASCEDEGPVAKKPRRVAKDVASRKVKDLNVVRASPSNKKTKIEGSLTTRE